MNDLEEKYDALLIDTSIYDSHGLRLEKGLLGKLTKFHKSPIPLLMPDVVKNEVQSHLEKKMKSSISAIKKSLNDARDHLFFDGSQPNDVKELLVKELLIERKEVEKLAESRINKFIDNCGIKSIECGGYVSVSEVLTRYFSNQPPFSESGKKRNKFPDAFILLAVKKWAESENKKVLAITKDIDWWKFCENCSCIDYKSDLSSGLSIFSNAQNALLSNLEIALKENTAQSFLEGIHCGLEAALNDLTPDQEAQCFLLWDPEGICVQLKKFDLIDNKLRIVNYDEESIVLEAKALITIEAEGEFSLSKECGEDLLYFGCTTASVEEEFESNIFIFGSFCGDIDDIDNLCIEEIEIVSPISHIDFGEIEPYS